MSQEYDNDTEYQAIRFQIRVILGLESFVRVQCIICHPVNMFEERQHVNEKTEGFHC